MDSALQNNICMAAPPCPQCNHQGIMVRTITVQSLILPELKEKIAKNAAYYLCSNPECNISYYDVSAKNIFEIKDVKVPIWF